MEAYQSLLFELLDDHKLFLEVQVRLVLIRLLPEVIAGVLRLSGRPMTNIRGGIRGEEGGG